MEFPEVHFPRLKRLPIARFWAAYWLRFFLLLPAMLVRQFALSSAHAITALWTGNRTYHLLAGLLDISYLSSYQVLPTSAIFGERFTALRYGPFLIDPGPLFARATVEKLYPPGSPITAIVITHFHEEHIGNAASLARRLRIPIYASAVTLAEIRHPQTLSPGRRMLMGQPEPGGECLLLPLQDTIEQNGLCLHIIAAPGHCPGHIALFDPTTGVLIAGDSFLHQVFTAPNGDVTNADWMETLRSFAALDVKTLVGAHGVVYSIAENLPALPFVVARQDPKDLIRAKLQFMEWAASTVARGERAGLPYSVIEASLFPWQHSWSWSTWFHDESFRLLTCGEFSRTHFVRSLSATPEQVPARFQTLSALAERTSHQWSTLLRIHLLAAHPFPVAVIVGSIALSIGMVVGAAVGFGSISLHAWYRIDLVLPSMIRAHAITPLVASFLGLSAWWAVVGGAITRWMARAILAQPRESFALSVRFCCQWALAVPSMLASCCFFLLLAAPAWPWLLVPVLPIWLLAGFLYGALTMSRQSLGGAIQDCMKRWQAYRQLLKLQVIILGSFATSTAMMYLLIGLWCLPIILLCHGWLGMLLMAPAWLYGVGYTTANLKSLQIYLYVAGQA